MPIALCISVGLIIWNRKLRVKARTDTEKFSAALEELQEIAASSKKVFDHASTPMAYCRFDGSLIDINQAFADLTGFSIQEALDLGNERITPLEYTVLDLMQFRQLKTSGQFGPYEKEFFHKNGQRKHIRLYGIKLQRQGETCAFVRCEDITEFKEIEKRAEYLAFHDPLTGLPNRRVAKDRLEQAITHADRERTLVGLLVIDLDDFKSINDTLGHSVGDQLFREIGARLLDNLRDSDTVTRLGGDELLVTLPFLYEAQGVARVLTNIMQRLRDPFEIEGHEISTSASIGISIYPTDGKDFETLLKNAEIAMYQAKDAGRDSYRFFDENMHVGMHTQLNLTNSLRKAIERREFILHYQPQVDLSNGDTIGAEALIRGSSRKMGWYHRVNSSQLQKRAD